MRQHAWPRVREIRDTPEPAGKLKIEITGRVLNIIGSSMRRLTIVPSAGNALAFSRADLIWPFAVTLIAAGLRIPYLTSKSLSLDEGFSVFMGRTDASTFGNFVWHGELNMVLYYMLLRIWIHLGSSELMIRLLSVCVAVASVPLVYLLGVRLFGRGAGVASSLLLAVHPAHIAFAQEARSYSLAVLLVCLSCLLFLHILDEPSRNTYAGYTLFSVAAVCSHFFAALVLIAQWVALPFSSRESPAWRKLGKVAALVAGLLAPIAIFLILRRHSQAAWILKPRGRDFAELFSLLAVPGLRIWIYLVCWSIAIWTAVSKWRRSRVEGWPYLFVVTWFLLPILLTMLVSVIRPALVPRFLLVCVPAAVLLAAAGFSSLFSSAKWSAIVLLSVAMLYSLSSVRFYYRHPDLKENWREATAYVLQHSKLDDGVIVLPAYAQFTFDYYKNPKGKAVPPRLSRSDWKLHPGLPRREWFLASSFVLADASENEVKTFQTVQAGVFHLVEHRQFSGVKVWLFERPSP